MSAKRAGAGRNKRQGSWKALEKLAKTRAKQRPRRGPTQRGKTFYALVTTLNLLLSVLVSVLNRREVLHAVQEDEDIRLLLTEKARRTRQDP